MSGLSSNSARHPNEDFPERQGAMAQSVGARPPVHSENGSDPHRRGKHRLPRLALLIGLGTILLSLLGGYLAYRSSRSAVRDAVAEQNLATSQTIVNETVSRLNADKEKQEPLDALAQTWKRTVPPYPGTYLCVIDASGRLAMHTARPDLVGRDVSQRRIDHRPGQCEDLVADLLRKKGSYAGVSTTLQGTEQLVGYAYFEPLDGLVVTHIPGKKLDAQILAVALPWGIALMVLLGCLLPLSLILLHLAYRQADRFSQAAISALTNRERDLARAQGIAQVGNWEYRVSDGRIRWSDELYRIFGLEPQSIQLTYETLSAMVHPEDRDSHNAYLEQMLQAQPGQILSPLEYRLIRPGGEERVVQVHVEMELDEQNSPCMAFGTVQDITDRKAVELRLQESEQKYRHVVETVHDLIWSVDNEGRWTFVNRSGALSIYGYEPEEMLGRPFTDFLSPEQAQKNLQVFERVKRGALLSRYETENVRKEGSPVILSFNAIPLYDDEGQFLGATGTAIDITYHKAAEMALRDSERRYIDLYENAPDMMVSVDPATASIVQCNRALPEAMGCSKEELVGQSVYGMYAPESAERVRTKVLPEFRASGRIEGEELKLQCANGSTRDVVLKATAVRDQDGRILYSRSVLRDVTDLKQTEQALRESEEKFRAAFQSSPLLLVIGTLDGKCVEVNQAFCHLVQYSREELIGRTAFELGILKPQPPEDPVAAVEQGNGSMHNAELQVHARDGTIIDTIFSFERAMINGVPHHISTGIDISRRKEAERALRESEERLRLFIEHAPVALAMFDREMRYLAVSHRWLKDFSLSITDITGQSHYDIFPEIPQRWKAIHQRVFQGEVIKAEEDYFERSDGSGQWLRWEVRPWRTEEGEIGGIVIFSEDITRRKLAEGKLRQSQQRLTVLSRELITAQETERRHLARELHDEIGQVLTAISINLKVLRNAKDEHIPSRLDECIQIVDQAVEQVRDLSLDLRPVMLDDFGLEAALRSFTARFAERTGIPIDYQASDSTWKDLPYAVQNACFRVVQEALTNVMRHAQATEVRVELRKDEKGLSVLIQDNGKGFEVEPAHDRATQGTSLGLLSMQERMELLGGSLEIQSTPGSGTEIRAWFSNERLIPVPTGQEEMHS